MLKLFLKLYPPRFVDRMGEEWLRDTRQELINARQQGGLRAYATWLLRLVVGTIQGARQAYRNEFEVVCERGIEIQCGNQVVLLKKGTKEYWTIQRYIFMSAVGATIMGYVGCKMWLAGWVNGALELEIPQYTTSLMLWMYLGGMALFVCAGAWITWAHRVHLRSIKSSLLNLVWIALIAHGAWGVAFINWTLADLGNTSTEAVETFVDYPETLKAMGLRDQNGDAVYWYAQTAQDFRCDRSVAVLNLAKHQSLRRPGDRLDVVGVLLVDSMAQSLWTRGCLSEDQRITFNEELVAGVQLDKLAQRRLSWRGLGKLEEGRKLMVTRLAMTHEDLCNGRMAREQMKAGGKVDEQAISNTCMNIPNAKNGVSPIPTTG